MQRGKKNKIKRFQQAAHDDSQLVDLLNVGRGKENTKDATVWHWIVFKWLHNGPQIQEKALVLKTNEINSEPTYTNAIAKSIIRIAAAGARTWNTYDLEKFGIKTKKK